MNSTLRNGLLATTALTGLAFAGPANASLTLFNSFTGNELVSTDGCGSATATCTLDSNIQAGSTIQAAYFIARRSRPRQIRTASA
jgi:hypothetical protein